MDYLCMTSLERGLPPVMLYQGIPNNAICPTVPSGGRDICYPMGYNSTYRRSKQDCRSSGIDHDRSIHEDRVMMKRDAVSGRTYGSIFLVLLLSIAGALLMIGKVTPSVVAQVNARKDVYIASRPGEPLLPEPDIPGVMPGRGKLLIASRNMRDPRFRETVVLVVDYGKGGAAGLILNRPLDVRLAELMPDLPMLGKRKDKVFYGGPVEGHKMFLLIRSTKNVEESSKVLTGVHVSRSRTVLERMLAGKQRTPFRAYAGYAGWTSDQLDAEIARGDWRVMNAEVRMVFEQDPTKLWPELIRLSSAIQV